MMEPEEIYEQKINKILQKKSKVLAEIKLLMKEFERLEAEEDRLGTQEFIRTGVSTFTIDFNIDITERDMLRDLVQRTEGQNIKPEKPNQN